MKYCSNCGKNISKTAKFCGNCGAKLNDGHKDKERTSVDSSDLDKLINKETDNFLSKHVFGKGKNIKEQILDYDKLGVFKSFRGQACLAVLIVIFISLLLALSGNPDDSNYYYALVYLPVVYFIYKGKKWAIILMMLAYSLEQLYNLFYLNGGLMAIFWWLIITGFMYRAFIIEKIRAASLHK